MPHFSPFNVTQAPSCCGPCSLSACLFMLGERASQEDIVQKAGYKHLKSFVKEDEGLDELELATVARRHRAVPRQLLVSFREKGSTFARKLREHVMSRGVAILLIHDFAHWVAVVGFLPSRQKFVVYDPQGKKPFERWPERQLLREAWNATDDEDDPGEDPDQYFAILLRRKDGRKPVWRPTEPWMRIHERGADVTAGTIASDLRELVENAAGARRRVPRFSECEGGTTLAAVLRTYRQAVLAAILAWEQGAGLAERADLAGLYDDYVVCAEAADIVFPKNTDHAMLVAGLAALFSAYWWGAGMDDEVEDDQTA